MTAVEQDETIRNALIKAQRAGGKELKEKLQILLAERKVNVITESSQIECLSVLGTGAFGKVELIRFRKKFYAQKRALHRTAPQLISIIDEGIKLTDICDQHRNIQRLNFINLDCYGIIIDYCSNGSLHSFISNEASKYNLTDVLNWSYQLADALSFLHNHDMIHRDVKTQNILLKDDRETLVLTDYGTATQMKKIQMTNNVGTPITMAPEVYAYDRYSEQCDTFSWSIVVWQLICKQATPYSPTDRAIAWSVFNDKLRPNKIEPCPEIFKALLYRSWHSNPNERPSLTFIKTVLNMILKVLPKTKTQEISVERKNQLMQQWTMEFQLSDKYLPIEPRSDNQESMNIYQNHVKVMENIIEIQKKLKETNENLEKFSEYDRLLEENKELKSQIDALRGQT